MQNKIAIIILLPLIIIFIVLSNQSDAELDAVIRNAIVTAYMNGYADALEIRMEEIKELKINRKLFRKEIEQAAAKYIAKVENMNN